jgi:hypothetical protein
MSLENKYLKARFCCNCNRFHFGEPNRCIDCGHLFVEEITMQEYKKYCDILMSRKKSD